MGVPVVDVVHMRVRMHEGLVNMLVLVMFCQM
jgi:Asp/Glu/hydantoin racemase